VPGRALLGAKRGSQKAFYYRFTTFGEIMASRLKSAHFFGINAKVCGVTL